MTASGRTPIDRHNSVSETITANSTGCTTSTRSRPGAPGAPRSTSINDQSTNSANASAHTLICSAKTGAVSSNSMPMPSHWEPWPGKTNTDLPAGVAWPVITDAPGSSSANSPKPVSNWPRSLPSTTARCSKVDRPANDHPTSAAANCSRAPTNSANRDACAPNATALLAETTQGTTDGREAGPSTGWLGGVASMIKCALVPLIPNDAPPARRARPSAGHARASVNNDTEPADQSTCGLGTSTCNVAGNTSWRIAKIIFITPATPAAACVWPMFDLIDPNHSGDCRSCP